MEKKKKKKNNNNNLSSNSLVFGRWPQTQIFEMNGFLTAGCLQRLNAKLGCFFTSLIFPEFLQLQGLHLKSQGLSKS